MRSIRSFATPVSLALAFAACGSDPYLGDYSYTAMASYMFGTLTGGSSGTGTIAVAQGMNGADYQFTFNDTSTSNPQPQCVLNATHSGSGVTFTASQTCNVRDGSGNIWTATLTSGTGTMGSSTTLSVTLNYTLSRTSGIVTITGSGDVVYAGTKLAM